jgi:hypothetical protein
VTHVTIGSSSTVITLDRRTVVEINAHRPVTHIGSGMGVQGPRGEPGFSGAGVIEPITWSWGDAESDVYVPATAGTLVMARLKIDTAFNGDGASIRVGTLADPEVAIPSEWIDPYQAIEVENTPDILLGAGQAVRLSITPGTASQGSGRLFLQFLPTS